MRTHHLIEQVSDHVQLKRDSRSGIAWVQDGRTGNGHSAHPNIDETGSVHGMKKLGYWDWSDVTVICNGFIHNVSKTVVTDNYDRIAARHCRCPGCL